jgi:eukaryotic-like serine/threonine-protein kinase
VLDYSGQSIGRYHVIEKLGKGGMAIVYKAYDTRLERDVAIKVIRTDAFPPAALERVLARFEREAKLLAKLDHPNIVAIYDYGEFENVPYLVMPYLPGGTLKVLIGKPMPYPEACKLLAPVARGLEYAHQHGMVHRDVRPSNILFSADGFPRISDFGIGKLFEEEGTQNLTETGVSVGTPEYMAPEQWLNRVTPQSDIYSLGIVFYELLTGRVPYRADTPAAVLLKQNTDLFPQPKEFAPDLPKAVERILFKSLAKKPEDRYPSMREFVAALEELDSRFQIKDNFGPQEFQNTNSQSEDTHDNLIDNKEAIAPDHIRAHPSRILPSWFWPVLGGIGMLGFLAFFTLTNTLKPSTSLTVLVATKTAAVIPSQTTPKTLQPIESVSMSATSPAPSPSIDISSATPKLASSPTQIDMMLPVQAGTPLPLLDTVIEPQNADQLDSLARWNTGNGVTSIVFSPDGKLIASGSLDYTVKLRRISDGSLVNTLKGHTAPVRSVAFSPDGQLLASGSDDYTVKLWRVSDSSLVRTLKWFTNGVNSVSFSRDGQMLVGGSRDGAVRIWRASDGSLIQTLKGHLESVICVAFSPNGQIIASGSMDHTVKLWRVSDGSLVSTLRGQTDRMISVAFSPDGQILASGSGDHTIILWRANDGMFMHKLLGHTGAVYTMAFSPDGEMLASGSDDYSIKLWRMSDYTLVSTLQTHTNVVSGVAFSSDGQMLASGSYDNTIRLWGINR